jgi:hypothetical protein
LRGRSDWSFVSRARQRYADPTNRYLAGFASPWRRAAAAAIDWGPGFLLVSIPLGTVQALGAISREEGDLAGRPGHVLVVAMQVLTVAPAVAYFAILLPTSQTFGMRMREIRTVSMSTGRGASYTAAIIRGTTETWLPPAGARTLATTAEPAPVPAVGQLRSAPCAPSSARRRHRCL